MTPSRYIGALVLVCTPWLFVEALPSMGYAAVLSLAFCLPWFIGGALALGHAVRRRPEAERELLGFAVLGAALCWMSDLVLMASAFALAGGVFGSERTKKRWVLLPFALAVPAIAVLHVHLSSPLQRDIPPTLLLGHAVAVALGALSFVCEGWLAPCESPRPNP